MKGLRPWQETEWWIMQAASANLTSVMCWVIIAQTIASPDPGNVLLHFWGHLYKRMTVDFTSGEKQENWTVFSETARTRMPIFSWPFRVWTQLPRPCLAGGPGVSSSWEIRSRAFPQGWPCISHDARGLRTGNGMWHLLRLSQSPSIARGPPSNMA